MTTIPQFWFYSAALIALLLVLLVAQFFRPSRNAVPPTDTGIRWFNALILLMMVLGVLYLTCALELHRKRLSALIDPYPSARYAPERESFTGNERWIYVTPDHAENIIAFYQQASLRSGYALLIDKGTTTTRLLFSRAGKQIFLTIENENDTRVLYYSQDGGMRFAPR